MKSISADQARKITDEYFKSVNIESFVSSLSEEIEQTARGGNSIDPRRHLERFAGEQPNDEQWTALRKHFEKEGFTWKEHIYYEPMDHDVPLSTLSW